MTTQHQPPTPPVTDFDAAKQVVDVLTPLNGEQRERVLRWVGEALGISAVRAAAAPVQIQQPTAVQHGQAASRGKDMKSFIAEKGPRSDNQFAAAVAYYWRFEAPEGSRKNRITAADLQDACRLAQRSRLGRPRQTLVNAAGMGYLDRVAQGEYSLNTVGENLVAVTLPGGGASPPQVARASKGKAKGKNRK